MSIFTYKLYINELIYGSYILFNVMLGFHCILFVCKYLQFSNTISYRQNEIANVDI